MTNTVSIIASAIKSDSRSCGGCGNELRGAASWCGTCGLRQSGFIGKILGRYFLIRKCLVLVTLSVISTGAVAKSWGVMFPALTNEQICQEAHAAHREAESAIATATVYLGQYGYHQEASVANEKIAQYHQLRDKLPEAMRKDLPELAYVAK